MAFAKGATARMSDPDLLDAAFLANHPAWTWADLQATPARVIDALRLVDAERAG